MPELLTLPQRGRLYTPESLTKIPHDSLSLHRLRKEGVNFADPGFDFAAFKAEAPTRFPNGFDGFDPVSSGVTHASGELRIPFGEWLCLGKNYTPAVQAQTYRAILRRDADLNPPDDENGTELFYAGTDAVQRFQVLEPVYYDAAPDRPSPGIAGQTFHTDPEDAESPLAVLDNTKPMWAIKGSVADYWNSDLPEWMQLVKTQARSCVLDLYLVDGVTRSNFWVNGHHVVGGPATNEVPELGIYGFLFFDFQNTFAKLLDVTPGRARNLFRGLEAPPA